MHVPNGTHRFPSKSEAKSAPTEEEWHIGFTTKVSASSSPSSIGLEFSRTLAKKMPHKTQLLQCEINELRRRFLTKCERIDSTGTLHVADIDRIRNMDLWCIRFLEAYGADVEVSLQRLWETCLWRNKYGANDLHESNVNMDYVKRGIVFVHNRDIDGKPLLIFQTRLHTRASKDLSELMRSVLYWIERMHRESNTDKITIVFDMDGSCLVNIDLEFIRHLIDTLKLYYPGSLNYILVYEMSWYLSAAFQLIKTLLPQRALQLLRLVTKKNITDFIDRDNCLTKWGGRDDYQFSFVPEVQKADGHQE